MDIAINLVTFTTAVTWKGSLSIQKEANRQDQLYSVGTSHGFGDH